MRAGVLCVQGTHPRTGLSIEEPGIVRPQLRNSGQSCRPKPSATWRAPTNAHLGPTFDMK